MAMIGGCGVVCPRPAARPCRDQLSLGVLASYVPRDVVDEAVEQAGKAARRSDVELTPGFVVYFVMALALFADDDYEEVALRMAGVLADWGEGFDPSSGGLSRARKRLGPRPLELVFSQVARPVAEEDTVGAFFGRWRVVSIDGLTFDAEASMENIAVFGQPGTAAGEASVTQVRGVTISECASHAPLLAALGPAGSGKGSGERTLARPLLGQLDSDWILLADRGFYGFADWCAADDSGAALLWRVGADLRLPVLRPFDDGSYLSVVIDPKARGRARETLLATAAEGLPLDRARARHVRVVEYDIPDRDGSGSGSQELFALITNVLGPADGQATALAALYAWRWEHETGNQQLKTYLRGPGKILRSRLPELVYQEVWGYLLTHYALAALICRAATAAGIDPDRVRYKRTLRIVRRRVADPSFSP